MGVKHKRNIPVKELTPEQRKNKREKAREYHLKRLYGIDLEGYNKLLKEQDHRCYICNKHENEFKKKLHVDHNHSTGEIRGLLCYNCNHNIVRKTTDPEIALKLYQYLQKHTGLFVPVKTKKTKRKKNVKRKQNN